VRREAGANVTLRFEPAGQPLVFGDIEAAKEWLRKRWRGTPRLINENGVLPTPCPNRI